MLKNFMKLNPKRLSNQTHVKFNSIQIKKKYLNSNTDANVDLNVIADVDVNVKSQNKHFDKVITDQKLCSTKTEHKIKKKSYVAESTDNAVFAPAIYF